MHLIPKVLFLYFMIELIFTNFYFNMLKDYITLFLIIGSLCCLIIGILYIAAIIITGAGIINISYGPGIDLSIC